MSFLDLLKQKPAHLTGNRWRCRVKRTTQIQAFDATRPAHAEPGDIIEIAEKAARDLVADGTVERLAVLDENGEVVEAAKMPAAPVKPAKAVPVALPADYAELPKPFATAHGLLAEREALVADLHAARERSLPPDFVKARKFAEKRGEHAGKYWLASSFVGVEAVNAQIQLCDEAVEAEEALRAWDIANGYRLAAAHLESGREVIDAAEKLNVAVAELARVGFELFRLRIAPLELHEMKERHLFTGSALHQKYNTHATLTPPGIVWLGGTNPARGMDEPLTSMVSYFKTARRRLAEIEALLVEARAELAAAQGVTANPAKPTKKAA
ncbi:MAG: hypothetical protein H7067_19850 [Burkholderiales bacterium]|nr:hypothetical protein [Opitutaceae bacterium]